MREYTNIRSDEKRRGRFFREREQRERTTRTRTTRQKQRPNEKKEQKRTEQQTRLPASLQALEQRHQRRRVFVQSIPVPKIRETFVQVERHANFSDSFQIPRVEKRVPALRFRKVRHFDRFRVRKHRRGMMMIVMRRRRRRSVGGGDASMVVFEEQIAHGNDNDFGRDVFFLMRSGGGRRRRRRRTIVVVVFFRRRRRSLFRWHFVILMRARMRLIYNGNSSFFFPKNER